MEIITKKDVTLTVSVPFSTRHIDEFIKLKSAPELIQFFPDSKEITEAMGVFAGIRKCRDVYPTIMGNPDVLCVVPGDGVSPRVGSIAAYRTRWQIHSVDPNMRIRELGIERLTIHKKKIEEVEFPYSDTVVIMSCHSHVELDTVLKSVKARRYIVIALQCCVPMFITDRLPKCEFRDIGVFSRENLIKIWSWE